MAIVSKEQLVQWSMISILVTMGYYSCIHVWFSLSIHLSCLLWLLACTRLCECLCLLYTQLAGM